MRTSILSRSVIAVASLAIGSVALAATPATAATPSGVTRDQVLTAVNNWRTAPTPTFYYTVVEPQLRAIVTAGGCDVAAGDDVYFDLEPTATGQAVDGALIKTYIDRDGSDVRKQCLVAVVASTDASKTLTGSLTLNAETNPRTGGPTKSLTPTTYALSGDVFMTTPISFGTDTVIGNSSFAANGNTTKQVRVTTTVKVADKKTKSQKKNAKKKLDQRSASAKKAYKKALKKAGKSKSKKAAAKKAYSKKITSYKATYKTATANYKLVPRTTLQTQNTPFAVNAAIVYAG